MPRKKKLNLPLLEVVIVSLLVHVAALVVLGGVTIWQTFVPDNSNVAEAPPQAEQPIQQQQIVKLDKSMKQSSRPTKVVSVNVTPNLQMPELDIDIPIVPGRIAVGTGAGLGRGTRGDVLDFSKTDIPFFGIKDSGERILFIVDYSGSMSAKTESGETRFDLLKEQLNATLSAISSQVFAEVIFFSGPAWVAGETESQVRSQYKSEPAGTPGHWHTFRPKDPNNISTPTWKRMADSERRKLMSEVNRQGTSGGTVWSNPLLLARRLDPAPDVIYFLTDGATSDDDVELTYDLVKDWRQDNRNLRINTIALGEPRAVDGMKQIARRTGGEFRLIESRDDIEKLAQN